jgi:hypothetical protein
MSSDSSIISSISDLRYMQETVLLSPGFAAKTPHGQLSELLSKRAPDQSLRDLSKHTIYEITPAQYNTIESLIDLGVKFDWFKRMLSFETTISPSRFSDQFHRLVEPIRNKSISPQALPTLSGFEICEILNSRAEDI